MICEIAASPKSGLDASIHKEKATDLKPVLPGSLKTGLHGRLFLWILASRPFGDAAISQIIFLPRLLYSTPRVFPFHNKNMMPSKIGIALYGSPASIDTKSCLAYTHLCR